MNYCVTFISNKGYINSFYKTCNDLINKGEYKGEITLLIGNDIEIEEIKNETFIINNKINIIQFPDITFSENVMNKIKEINTDGRNITKFFQYHKLYLFSSYFKKWDYVFYIDCCMIIHNNINPMLNLFKEGKLVAMSDAYPSYEWKLSCQFDKSKKEYENLSKNLNLDIDYFQTGIMLYDTKLIKNETFNDLYNLVIQYPISRTNEQGIMNLYFNGINKNFSQIDIENENFYFYSFRENYKNKPYIITRV